MSDTSMPSVGEVVEVLTGGRFYRARVNYVYPDADAFGWHVLPEELYGASIVGATSRGKHWAWRRPVGPQPGSSPSPEPTSGRQADLSQELAQERLKSERYREALADAIKLCGLCHGQGVWTWESEALGTSENLPCDQCEAARAALKETKP